MGVATALVTGAFASPVAAQTTFWACRVPAVGVLYMIADGSASCLDGAHVKFSWTDGGAPPANSITSAMIVDGTIAVADLGAGSVSSATLLDGGIARADLGAGVVTPSKVATDSIFNFTGPQGTVSVHPTFAPLSNTTLLTTFASTANIGTQVRFDGSGAGFWDVGLNGTGNLVIENSDVAMCTLTTFWSCAPKGVAQGNANSSTVTLTGTYASIVSVTITVPVAGRIELTYTGTGWTENEGRLIQFQFGTSAGGGSLGVPSYAGALGSSATVIDRYHALSLIESVAVGAGTYTYHLNAADWAGAASGSNIFASHIRAVFIPN